MAGTCVVHLARQQNGIVPFQTFIESYRDHASGTEHDLLIIFKGFHGDGEVDLYRVLLDGLRYESLFVPDSGFDIVPYFTAAHSFEYQYFCFLNSYSVLLDRGWLDKMYRHVTRSGVGVVGATGSWESIYSTALRTAHLLAGRSLPERVARMLVRQLRGRTKYRWYFPPFPNYHLRTNAFLLSRDVMLNLKSGGIRAKVDAARFESGRQSLTRQIAAMGLQVLVVGRDGKAYEKDQWFESHTFRSGDQANLLVDDNRTRYFQQADADTKRVLLEVTWGEEVRRRR